MSSNSMMKAMALSSYHVHSCGFHTWLMKKIGIKLVVGHIFV